MRVVSDANCAVVSGANFAVVNDTATHPTPPLLRVRHPWFGGVNER